MTPIYFWNQMNEEEKKKALIRPEKKKLKKIQKLVYKVIQDVKNQKDKAVKGFSLKFDKIRQTSFKVEKDEMDEASSLLSDEVKQALITSAKNIEKFHRAQKKSQVNLEILPGLHCWQELRAIERVGFYIPSGSAPLCSTFLMLGLPAKIAGCPKRIACVSPAFSSSSLSSSSLFSLSSLFSSPSPSSDSKSHGLHPALLYSAQLVGVEEIYKIGGAQAIAAMAFGTESVPRVDKIFGPGNIYVTQAKLILSQDPSAATCDLPASASEQLCIVDGSAKPEFVASDLLSQAEHSREAHVLLIALSHKQVQSIHREMKRQWKSLPRKDIIKTSLSKSASIVVSDLKTALEVSNFYAPEHLVLHIKKPESMISEIQNAGSVFVGEWTPESLGDYSSGTNHVLPTSGFARSISGLSLESFYKKISFQKATPKALKKIGPCVEIMAKTEGLGAHAHAMKIRLQKLKSDPKTNTTCVSS